MGEVEKLDKVALKRSFFDSVRSVLDWWHKSKEEMTSSDVITTDSKEWNKRHYPISADMAALTSYVEILDKESDELDDFLRENFPGEPGDKTPVDAAIKIMEVLQSRIQKAKHCLNGSGA